MSSRRIRKAADPTTANTFAAQVPFLELGISGVTRYGAISRVYERWSRLACAIAAADIVAATSELVSRCSAPLQVSSGASAARSRPFTPSVICSGNPPTRVAIGIDPRACAIVTTALCVAVFVWGLGLPYPLLTGLG